MRAIYRTILPALLIVFASAFLPAARAQTDLSGTYSQTASPDNTTDPFIGDYTGLPINDADRLRADSWTAEKWDQEQHECDPHPADYGVRAPGGLRIWPDLDPLTYAVLAWHIEIFTNGRARTVYMDGRPQPSEYAAQTWNGFSTGKWQGDKLEVSTTHLKEGWLRRNGLARSNKATLTEYYIRHGDFLTIVTIVKDPVYLTEPLIRTEHWFLNPGYTLAPFLCTPRDVVDKPPSWVPHHLPGSNDFLKEFPSNFGIPVEATRGGADSMYPEYLQRLATLPPPPPPPAKSAAQKP